MFSANSTFASGLNISLCEKMQPLIQTHVNIVYLNIGGSPLGGPTKWSIHIFQYAYDKTKPKNVHKKYVKEGHRYFEDLVMQNWHLVLQKVQCEGNIQMHTF